MEIYSLMQPVAGGPCQTKSNWCWSKLAIGCVRFFQKVLPKVSQEMLAGMIGTTRSRVNFFMNKFRKLGFIRYDGEIHVNDFLLSVVLHD
jgi:hypothetical protein